MKTEEKTNRELFDEYTKLVYTHGYVVGRNSSLGAEKTVVQVDLQAISDAGSKILKRMKEENW